MLPLTYVTERIVKLVPIHVAVIYKIPWFHWIYFLFPFSFATLILTQTKVGLLDSFCLCDVDERPGSKVRTDLLTHRHQIQHVVNYTNWLVLSVRQSHFRSVCLSVCVRQSHVCSVCLSVCLCAAVIRLLYLSVCLSVCLCVAVTRSLCLSVCSSHTFALSVHPSVFVHQ